jgi:hypothetical protein
MGERRETRGVNYRVRTRARSLSVEQNAEVMRLITEIEKIDEKLGKPVENDAPIDNLRH